MDLIKLCEISPKEKWRLLYRGGRDGFTAKDFHEKCDGKSNTLAILKAKDTSFIFIGYTSAAWEYLAIGEYKYDPTAFIFSLSNKDKQPFKSKIQPNLHDKAIYCRFDEGPSFGEGDIAIIYSYGLERNSSDFGISYINPRGNVVDKFVLAGSDEFQLSEIEVYKKE
jgi:hypothetical protein